MSEQTKPTGLALMRQAFADNQISTMCRSTKKDNQKGLCSKCGGLHGLPAIQLTYVGHAAVTDRLLDADPNWTWEPVSFGPDGYPVIDKDGGMWIRLTVCGVTRLGYGDAPQKSGGDAMKERIGDAIRNAAMRFGAGLELWHKGQLHVEEDEPFDLLPHLQAMEAATTLDALKAVYEEAFKAATAANDSSALKMLPGKREELSKKIRAAEPLSEERFSAAITKLKAGEIKTSTIRGYNLTEAQQKALADYEASLS